jgi:hypothetical protein
MQALGLTPVIIGGLLHQAGPLLHLAQFGLRLVQIRPCAAHRFPLGGTGGLNVGTGSGITMPAGAIEVQGSLCLSQYFLPSPGFVSPVSQPFLQPVQRAADLDLGSVEGLLRLGREPVQGGFQLTQGLEREDMG